MNPINRPTQPEGVHEAVVLLEGTLALDRSFLSEGVYILDRRKSIYGTGVRPGKEVLSEPGLGFLSRFAPSK